MRSATAHAQHVQRLAAYWAEALGGPTMYSDSYGDETAVVKMHSSHAFDGRDQEGKMMTARNRTIEIPY
jgi:hypothetical protein